jgi:glycosyltransferase involved in cell wall biosynthesis
MKDKIIFISSTMMPLEVFLLDQIKLLSNKYEVILISNINNYNINVFKNFQIKHIPISRNINIYYDFISLVVIFKILFEIKPKLVISITPKAGFILTISNFFLKNKHLHFITGQNWINKKGVQRLFFKLLDKFTFYNASSMLVDSNSQINFLKSENFNTDHMKLINSGSICGVNSKIFIPNSQYKNKKRKILQITKYEIIILYLGRMHKDKGIFELYEVCRKLFNEGFQLKLFLVGSIEDQKFNNIINNNQSFICHFVHNNFPQKFLQIADIFCIPSFREGFGLSVIEASACELPVIGTNINGLKDSIVDNHTGILFNFGDSFDFYNKLKKLIMDKNLRKNLGKNGRKRVLSDFNKNDVLKFIDLHIQKIIN